MPRYQVLGGGWSVGQYLIPPGTILEYKDGKADWNGIPLPSKLPIDLMALDYEAEDLLKSQHPGLLHHRILRPPHVDFEDDRSFDAMIARRLEQNK
jgi:hypothetical protein